MEFHVTPNICYFMSGILFQLVFARIAFSEKSIYIENPFKNYVNLLNEDAHSTVPIVIAELNLKH